MYLVASIPVVFSSQINLEFDQNGNLISGDGNYREYNSLNQLARVYNGSNSTGRLLESFEYHPTQERVHVKTVYNDDGTNETTIYISENFVRVMNSSGIFDYTYVYHEGMLVAQVNPSGEKLFIHGNNEGSSSVVTNSSGGIVENTSYSPFGEILEGGSKTRFNYENKEFDSVLRSVDFHFRQYKPEWGIFEQPDTIIWNIFDPQLLNHYSFERNNPYHYVDPTGHIEQSQQYQYQDTAGNSVWGATPIYGATENYKGGMIGGLEQGFIFVVGVDESKRAYDKGRYEELYQGFYKDNPEYGNNPYVRTWTVYEVWPWPQKVFEEKKDRKISIEFLSEYSTWGKQTRADFKRLILDPQSTGSTSSSGKTNELILDTKKEKGVSWVNVGQGVYVRSNKVKAYLRYLKWKESQAKKTQSK